MKNRYWLIAVFILILPLSLYFFFKYSPDLPVKRLSKLTEKYGGPDKTQHTDQSSTVKQVIQHWVSDTGARVFFVAANEIPMLDIQVNFAAGSARDGDKPGLAMLITRLLDKGTQELNANQIAEKFGDAGVQYQANIDRDRAIISLRTLTNQVQLNSSIELFAKLLANATFPDQSIELEKNLMTVELKQKDQLPNITAAKAFFKALYHDHPYGHPVFGTEAGITAITKNDLIKFHQDFFVAKNANITIVGDITKEQAKEISNQISKNLLSGNMADALPMVPKLATPEVVSITLPTEQTHVMLGQPCAVQGDPDYFALLVGNYILGGNFLNSRLYKEVRDDRGLAYSIASALREYQQPGPFLIQLQTKNDQSSKAIEVVKQTLEKFVKEGPTEQEVLEAKQGIISGFPLDISSNAKMTTAVSNIGFYKLPLDFLDLYQQQVQKTTAATIKETFQRRIDPEKMALITVGSPKN